MIQTFIQIGLGKIIDSDTTSKAMEKAGLHTSGIKFTNIN